MALTIAHLEWARRTIPKKETDMEYVLLTIMYVIMFGLGYLAAHIRLTHLQNRAIKVLKRDITVRRAELQVAQADLEYNMSKHYTKQGD